MHPTALANAKRFFDTYLADKAGATVVDVGSLDVNGTMRGVAPPDARYIGLDMEAGAGVDIVLEDPYRLPLESGSADAVVSSSCFEHCELFWVLFLEMLRVLRPNGLIYINAPANGPVHLYPVDCWRFYPDAGGALVAWAARSGETAELLESYISNPRQDVWKDFVAVIGKGEAVGAAYPRRILETFRDCEDTRGVAAAAPARPRRRLFPFRR